MNDPIMKAGTRYDITRRLVGNLCQLSAKASSYVSSYRYISVARFLKTFYIISSFFFFSLALLKRIVYIQFRHLGPRHLLLAHGCL